jgi:hypothetical protein
VQNTTRAGKSCQQKFVKKPSKKRFNFNFPGRWHKFCTFVARLHPQRSPGPIHRSGDNLDRAVSVARALKILDALHVERPVAKAWALAAQIVRGLQRRELLR